MVRRSKRVAQSLLFAAPRGTCSGFPRRALLMGVNRERAAGRIVAAFRNRPTTDWNVLRATRFLRGGAGWSLRGQLPYCPAVGLCGLYRRIQNQE
jgi:hypothetical protein